MTFFIDTIDKRNQVLFELLKKEHKKVDVFNLLDNSYSDGDTIIFAPSKKIDEEYTTYLPSNITLYGGTYSESVVELLKRKNINYINLLQDETFAIKNANLTCEGVLSLIISHSPKSMYDNNILLLGAGRIAKGMAIILNKLGVKFSLASFNKAKFPENYIYSQNNYFAYDFVRDLEKFDVIINTIPAEILDENIINKIAKNTIFIETASVNCLDKEKVQDFEYILAPALPQKFAPITAGKIMRDCIFSKQV